METLGSFIFEVGRCLANTVSSRFATLKNFQKNIQTLREELQKLICRENDITEDIDIAKIEGKHPPGQVKEWLKNVDKIKHEVEEIEQKARLLLEADPLDASIGRGCFLDSNMCQKYQLSKSAAKKCDELKQLIKESCDLPPMEDRKLSDIRVEHIPAPSLVGQKAPEKLNQLMELLADKRITRIAVYGMGGSGKTTLVKTLNNRLESSASEFFDMVIWVPVSNDLDMKKVQSRVAERLNLALNAEESTERRACKLHRVLKSGKREMMTDKELKMELLNEEEAWNLFAQNAGNVVESEDINPLAREIARECGGLPLAIETMGKSMRDKTMIQLWQNALRQLKHSEPHYGSFDKVYLRLKLSYNSLPSKIFKWCFLSCSLYPENFLIKTRELIYCWIAEGLIGERQTLEESFNDGIAKLEYLKDSCMLEQGEGIGTVKMHSVLREVAIWISQMRKKPGFSAVHCKEC
ncbi:disease resistance protein [Prunus yedoensis var. nudiflora]|uniref:Disease resistance protein n=1 Tax=Prunus yedoensis var. nudiflora TaxID=2094558 RepID=A0A314Z4A8_PRUYE|nr:disease resistance protein [Prunus yedoensis var. nudiflora]